MAEFGASSKNQAGLEKEEKEAAAVTGGTAVSAINSAAAQEQAR